jgi:hypothetical protein
MTDKHASELSNAEFEAELKKEIARANYEAKRRANPGYYAAIDAGKEARRQQDADYAARLSEAYERNLAAYSGRSER